MAKNRKNGSAGRFAPAVKAALICVLLGGSAIGYVYQKNQIIDLGRQIQQRERSLARCQDDNLKLEKIRLTLQSATSLDDRVKKLGLQLAQPSQAQILTIRETPAAVVPRSEPLYASSPAAVAR